MAIGSQLSIYGLPDEIILQVIRFSGWRGAKNLGQTCRRFYEVCNDSGYWREQVAGLFDVNKEHDIFEGGKWKKAFRTLVESRVFAWGKGTGFMFDVRVPRGWDQDAHVPIEVGTLRNEKIVDIETGGWCTTMLTLSGEILMAGTFDRSPRPWTNQPRRLNFPVPDTKIIQLSAGRTHLLALSDRGEIWTYREQPHVIKFFEFDYAHGNNNKEIHGRVKKVVAGWGASAAIVEGYGVVIWWGDLQHRDPSEDLIREGYRFMNDGAHVWRVYTKKIPFLAPWRHFSPRAASTPSESKPRQKDQESSNSAWTTDGDYFMQNSKLQMPEYHLHPKAPLGPSQSWNDEVIDLMVGEDFLVALTRVGELFVVDIRNPHTIEDAQPTQLLRFRPPPDQKPFNRLRGSFRTFAALNDDGSIYIGNQDIVFAALEAASPSPVNIEVLQNDTKAPVIIEDLQNSDIIDIAFGDWHCLALTKQGKVLSWGRESGACGSLGHGTHDEASRKGVTYRNAWAADGYLNHPTQVSFDPVPEKVTGVSGRQRFPSIRYLFTHPGPKNTVYPRAHKIAAGGWHSCALMSMEKKDVLNPPTTVMQADGSGSAKQQRWPNPGSPPAHPGEHWRGPNARLQPPKEHGHPKGAMGMERTGMGRSGELADGSMASGGNSFFGMTGGALTLGNEDRLSRSREAEKSNESEKGKEKETKKDN